MNRLLKNGPPDQSEADLPWRGRADLLGRIGELEQEVGQMKEAVASHAVVDHAIGVIIALGGLHPDQGFEVLRDVSRHTDTRLREIAEEIMLWVRTEQLAGEFPDALAGALARARAA
ncbi:ANTAR domain-containing protein [Streptomyces sp. NPDC048277]|uniref:ANTAR domain-containing protein n=1 Tax=Streptomyces sp. NPDC048277 TaxID=3155027 RepID=UPI0033E82B58